eukprot:TRINITY_DN4521_c0_g1_i1.p1 TRINITY_DN4521_c0_g1~~TRINITY_DN4521_c0_g1_i1.p1  ORF type:complete len:238 (+),score=53.68 TRINITY_DN4521_c0_g1_i1:1100-1813(+)
MLHKPGGYICSRARELVGESKIIYDILPSEYLKLKPPLVCAGRLDKWASGLVIMSQDGDMVNRLASPEKESGSFGKVYEVKLYRNLTGNESRAFASGEITLRGNSEPCKPAKLEVIDEEEKLVRITLYEGQYHQVRRMLASLGNSVVSIKRIATGPIHLGNLAEGHFRELTKEEIDSINQQSPPTQKRTKKNKYSRKKNQLEKEQLRLKQQQQKRQQEQEEEEEDESNTFRTLPNDI